MANETAAISWLLGQSNLNLNIESSNWISDVFTGWTDVCCTLCYFSRQIVSWGASYAPDIALLKSFAEGVERGVFLKEGSHTSNGFAAHIDHLEARRNAAFELMERDLFLGHFVSNMPFNPLEDVVLNQFEWKENVNTFSEKLNLRTHISIWAVQVYFVLPMVLQIRRRVD